MEKEKLVQNRGIYLIFFLFFGCLSSQQMDKTFYKTYLGLDIIPKKELYVYNENSAQNEGFNFSIIKYETVNNLTIKNGYPIKDRYREKWSVSEWKPISSNVIKDFDIIFKYRLEDLKTKQQIKDVKLLFESNSNYYSFYYKKSPKGDIYAIYLYILDVNNNSIYIFNVET
ncbi:hypothetical protein [Empedobacter brevis]|uniref:hypothetical protein n=1 Tax=Empedobacter brevis TaxID=247 RepID=UPI00333E7423